MSKTILITGLTRGIGYAIGQRFLREGYTVVGNGSTAESADALRQNTPQFDVYVADLRTKDGVKAFAEAVIAKYGRLDVLVNNAGRFVPGAIHQEDDSVYEELMALNMNASYYLAKAVLPRMIEAREGSIVNICSSASIEGYANGGSYCISKHAQLGLSRALREELKPHHIRVLSVMPGPVRTDSWAGAGLPPERFIQPEDIAEAVWTSLAMPQGSVVEELLIRPMKGNIGPEDFEGGA